MPSKQLAAPEGEHHVICSLDSNDLFDCLSGRRAMVLPGQTRLVSWWGDGGSWRASTSTLIPDYAGRLYLRLENPAFPLTRTGARIPEVNVTLVDLVVAKPAADRFVERTIKRTRRVLIEEIVEKRDA